MKEGVKNDPDISKRICFIKWLGLAEFKPRKNPGGYSTLAWTGVCRPDLGTLAHV